MRNKTGIVNADFRAKMEYIERKFRSGKYVFED